ncbi:hypothetical protein FHS43_003585 [Streptosporangium becharense]|uniref:Uncharacterized protein n=1 Tax=Streptosporangium becharense TaxID=1816182 RepID=A0A7W9IDT9_9ACTN|nr:hypothetical protein [Streptosporangium becharense]MBB2912305.1 hypothetical protein [Streptosporangium becharense]MBB5818852.1 hypothetical protein [Streptosporangium becharense]
MISRKSSATSGRTARRLLTWAVAATVAACGPVALVGSTAANAAVGHRVTVDDPENHYENPHTWLDSTPVLTSVYPPAFHVFQVSAKDGVPWIRDPRTTENSGWHNLRRIKNSEGGYVTNITIAQEVEKLLNDKKAVVRITARVAGGRIYSTLCDVTKKLPPVGYLPCEDWAAISKP